MAEPPPVPMNTTILLLVSDPVVRSVLKETLEREGYNVAASGDLGKAVEQLQDQTPDLFITRSYVESLPGYEAAMYLRTKCHGLKTLMVDGWLDDERLRYRTSVQGFGVFPKPYSAAELLAAVKDALTKPQG